MLTLGALLKGVNIDPATVIVFRHRPPQPDLRALLPSFVVEQPEMFRAYQSIQSPPAAAMMKRAKILAAFVGQDTGRAMFAGLSSIGGWREVVEADLASGTSQSRLAELGITFSLAPCAKDTFFDLTSLPDFKEWVGRLEVDWPSRGLNWKLWANRAEFNIRAIHEESRFSEGMPHWSELSLKWRILRDLPKSWREKLSGWRGIYYIFDEARRLGYVGSASGSENILGRWRDYAATGHGGNKQLRQSRADDLRFSILQLTEQDRDPRDVVRLEQTWMTRLMTRTHGLNANN